MRKPRGNDSSPRGPRGSGVAGLFVVPRLEELVADPSKAGVLDTRTARIIATKALGVFVASSLPIFEAEGPNNPVTRQARWRVAGRPVEQFEDVARIRRCNKR